jgi:hypothetical protein
MRRVATCTKTMRPNATIQLTAIELVIGKPNGRPISTAFLGKPCSGSAVSEEAMESAEVAGAADGRARPNVRQRRTHSGAAMDHRGRREYIDSSRGIEGV